MTGRDEIGRRYSAIPRMMTGLFTVATFLVRTFTGIMSSLPTLLARNFIHIGRLLHVNDQLQQECLRTRDERDRKGVTGQSLAR